MKLFDSKQRTDHNYASHLDNIYDFYDRSALKQTIEIRETLNLWFDNYPVNERSELKSRFQDEFSSAFFELFLHQLFLNLGFSLIPHPNVPGTAKKPDFLVSGHDLEFYMEARESKDKSSSEASIENRYNRLFDDINTIDTPNFFFRIISVKLKSQNQPSKKKLKQFIENKLTQFIPEEEHRKIDEGGLDNGSIILYEDETLRLEISLIPKSEKIRGKQGFRPIGIYPFLSFWGGTEDSIKKTIERKASKYGKLDKPYLICINSTSEKGTDHFDIMNSLFGSLQVSIDLENGHNQSWNRAFDGIFQNTKGPKHTRVSAILITHVHATNLHVANYWLVKHPFASKPLDLKKIGLKRIEVVNNQIETITGPSIKDLLKISDDWMKMNY